MAQQLHIDSHNRRPLASKPMARTGGRYEANSDWLSYRSIGHFLLAPRVKAQSWQDMQGDQNAIEEGREHVNHDRQELRHDLQNGDYGAAVREQAEIDRRQGAIRDREQDLNNDQANRYYYGNNEDGGYGGHQPWQPYPRHEDDDD